MPDSRVTSVVKALDVGFFAGGVALAGLGFALTRAYAPTADGSAIGLALATAGGTLAPTGNLVTAFSKDLRQFDIWVFVLTGLGLVLMGVVLVWSLMGGTIKDATNGLAVAMVAFGALLIPTGASPSDVAKN